MIIGTLQDGLDLGIFTNLILKDDCKEKRVNRLSLRHSYNRSKKNFSYDYIVKPLSNEYIPLDRDWFVYEVNQLIDYAERLGNEETRNLLSKLPFCITLNEYIKSFDLQLSIDELLLESDYQTAGQGIYLVSKRVNSKIILQFWYKEIRKRVFLWK